VALMEQVEAPAPDAPARPPIPDEVKVFVWNRDAGRCVKCGSRRRLEFDHVIPVSLGGANTSRNLQLLCEVCNREKGAALA
jgi:5-methylcytosine-specific restriction endonuclease McrA